MSATLRAAPRPAQPRRVRRSALALGAVSCAAALAGCSLPAIEETPPENDPAEAPIGSTTPDPAREALELEVGRLRATVAAAREELAAALDAGGVAAARTAADEALDVLVAEPGAAGVDPGDELRPLFPAESPDRGETEDASDQLTVTLTHARDVGGTLGSSVIDLLRDPIAGDLGAWQRDAAGVLASIDDTVAEGSTLEELDAAIGGLPGLGTRAVAWARLTADAGDGDDAAVFADRGVANLDVILVTLDRLGSDE